MQAPVSIWQHYAQSAVVISTQLCTLSTQCTALHIALPSAVCCPEGFSKHAVCQGWVPATIGHNLALGAGQPAAPHTSSLAAAAAATGMRADARSLPTLPSKTRGNTWVKPPLTALSAGAGPGRSAAALLVWCTGGCRVLMAVGWLQLWLQQSAVRALCMSMRWSPRVTTRWGCWSTSSVMVLATRQTGTPAAAAVSQAVVCEEPARREPTAGRTPCRCAPCPILQLRGLPLAPARSGVALQADEHVAGNGRHAALVHAVPAWWHLPRTCCCQQV